MSTRYERKIDWDEHVPEIMLAASVVVLGALAFFPSRPSHEKTKDSEEPPAIKKANTEEPPAIRKANTIDSIALPISLPSGAAVVRDMTVQEFVEESSKLSATYIFPKDGTHLTPQFLKIKGLLDLAPFEGHAGQYQFADKLSDFAGSGTPVAAAFKFDTGNTTPMLVEITVSLDSALGSNSKRKIDRQAWQITVRPDSLQILGQ